MIGVKRIQFQLKKFVIRKDNEGLWQVYKCGLFRDIPILGRFFTQYDALRAFNANYGDDNYKIIIK